MLAALTISPLAGLLAGLSGLCYNFAKEQQWRFNEGHGEPWLPMAGPSTFHTL